MKKSIVLALLLSGCASAYTESGYDSTDSIHQNAGVYTKYERESDRRRAATTRERIANVNALENGRERRAASSMRAVRDQATTVAAVVAAGAAAVYTVGRVTSLIK